MRGWYIQINAGDAPFFERVCFVIGRPELATGLAVQEPGDTRGYVP